MIHPRLPVILLSLLLPVFPGPTAGAADELPALDEVHRGMRQAVLFFRGNLSVAGGYASAWPLDLSHGQSEHRSSPTVIEIQPPGTPSIGLAMLAAYRATGDRLFLQGAREAASALAWCQLASGGWTADFDFDPAFSRRLHYRRDIEAGDLDRGRRNASSTLDDNKTQSALLLLIEGKAVWGDQADPDLDRALEFGLAGLLAAQNTNGGWPQQFDGPADPSRPALQASIPSEWPRSWSGDPYAHHDTLNDHNIREVVGVLLRAAEVLGDPQYREAAKRAGDFLLLAQHAEPQPGWSQQYDTNMHPVWARKFEPPALASVESLGAVETLLELWLATGEERFRAAIVPALDWLDRSRSPDGSWARFYELETNRPLYFEAETYALTYDDTNLPDHYAFRVDGSFGRKIDRMRRLVARSPEEVLRGRADPDSPNAWMREARRRAPAARQALETQDPRGFWADGERISAALFVQNLQDMAAYTEAANRARATGDD